MDANLRARHILGALVLMAVTLPAQTVLFDLENAPPQRSLPIDLTVDGVTAHLSATGQGFSIQQANTMGFTPPGFSGLCIYPNSVFAADLLVSFSHSLTNFSILYSPQELGCDDSARMKVTGYDNGMAVRTNTVTAKKPGTWPSETLSLSSATGFNSVVVHYDARPPTCQDYGVIFLADNMRVGLAPPPIVIGDAVRLQDGTFQLSFINTPGRAFTVLGTTNISSPPASWAVLGPVTEVGPGEFRFVDVAATNLTVRFYRVRSP